MDQKSKRQKIETKGKEIEIKSEKKPLFICDGRKYNRINFRIAEELITIQDKLSNKLLLNNYGREIYYIYNPIDYAKVLHESYIKTFCNGIKEVLLLGMNPGPWGMCQTGVPFGDINHVKNWLKLSGEVRKPYHQHSQRPIEGLKCPRTEISGDRLWSFLKELSGKPEVLFKHVFVYNYCPLAFLGSTGKNITPVSLKAKSRKLLEEACNEALISTVKLLNVKYLVCIGNYVTECVKKVIDDPNIQIITLMHPSPANPTANKGWKEIAISQLEKANILNLFNCDKCNS